MIIPTYNGVTIGTTTIRPGESTTTIAGLVSITSDAFVGALSGAASTAAASHTLSGTTLNSSVVTSSLTSVGSLSDLSIADGGAITFGSTTGTRIGGTGSKLALYGASAVVRASAITQTYATAARTNPAILTDSSGGTPSSTTIAAIANDLSGGVGLSSPTATTVNTELGAIRNNIATLAGRIVVLQELLNAVIDDLQGVGVNQ